MTSSHDLDDNRAPAPAPLTSGTTISALPKSWVFTASFPPDPKFPTPAYSHRTPRDQILPRQVRGALFSWIRPEEQKSPELLAVSSAAMRDLGLALSEAQTKTFRQAVVGNVLLHDLPSDADDTVAGDPPNNSEATTTTPSSDPLLPPPSNQQQQQQKKKQQPYPWAQCYGGFQFGQWAGQLGDGRAISLFEATNPRTRKRYEVQLKGCGVTPYSRFADGHAVLRSSLREFIVSEALHALRVPTARALAVSYLPHVEVVRDRFEPGAIVARMAETWLRLGTFDLLRARGERALLRRLAEYTATEVLGGWEQLPGRLTDPETGGVGWFGEPLAPEDGGLRTDLSATEVEGPAGFEENRFARLFRAIVRKNAVTVAYWQAYGFMNGVLNTDNTSILGLSIDFGPFAFMDQFDPLYTPNHDDYQLRYCYERQPLTIWANLTQLGEDLAELIGAGPSCDDDSFMQDLGKRPPPDSPPEPNPNMEAVVARAETIVARVAREYQAVYLAEYRRLMAARLGLTGARPEDCDELVSGLLDIMKDFRLDFNLFFRRLSCLGIDELTTEEARQNCASLFFYQECHVPPVDDGARYRIGKWLGRWWTRISEDGGLSSAEGADKEATRMAAMKKVNPNFIPRGWILDELIRRVEYQGERAVLQRVLHLALHPFESSWAGRTLDGVEYVGDRDEEERWTGDVPLKGRSMQCSCSS